MKIKLQMKDKIQLFFFRGGGRIQMPQQKLLGAVEIKLTAYNLKKAGQAPVSITPENA